MNEKEASMQSSIRDSLFVASMPVLSFMGAYLFEMGYADAFGYDYYFIELNIKSIVLGLVCVVAIFWPGAFIIFAMVQVIKEHGRIGRAIASPFIFTVFGIFGFIASGLESQFMKWFTISAVAFALFKLALVYIKLRWIGVSDALEKFATSEGILTFVGPPSPPSKPRVLDKLTACFMLTVILVFAGFLIRGAGVGTAHLKSSYTVIEYESHEYALVAVYGDTMVLAGITEEAHNKEILLKNKSSSSPFSVRNAYFPKFTSKKSLFLY